MKKKGQKNFFRFSLIGIILVMMFFLAADLLFTGNVVYSSSSATGKVNVKEWNEINSIPIYLVRSNIYPSYYEAFAAFGFFSANMINFTKIPYQGNFFPLSLNSASNNSASFTLNYFGAECKTLLVQNVFVYYNAPYFFNNKLVIKDTENILYEGVFSSRNSGQISVRGITYNFMIEGDETNSDYKIFLKTSSGIEIGPLSEKSYFSLCNELEENFNIEKGGAKKIDNIVFMLKSSDNSPSALIYAGNITLLRREFNNQSLFDKRLISVLPYEIELISADRGSATFNVTNSQANFICSEFNDSCGTCCEGLICLGGKCVKTSASGSECRDSDGGIDYFTKGTVNTVIRGRRQTVIDSCFYFNRILKETYCNSKGEAKIVLSICSRGCRNGACIK